LIGYFNPGFFIVKIRKSQDNPEVDEENTSTGYN